MAQRQRRFQNRAFIAAGRFIPLALFLVLLISPKIVHAQWACSVANCPVGNTGHIWNTNTGNVGIGIPTTQTPASKLHVGGDVTVIGNVSAYGSNPEVGYRLKNVTGAGREWLILSGGTGSTAPSALHIFDVTGSADRMVIDPIGRVGVGTTVPGDLLHVRSVTPAVTVDVVTDGQAATERGLKILTNSSGTSTNRWKVGVPADGTGDSGSNVGSDFIIQNFDDVGSALGTPLFIKRSTGNIGIGTSTPDAVSKLTVNGDVTITGNIAAKYQDVAEWVPSSKPLTAGMVVVLDMQRSNQVLPSFKSYDTGVAGVVSAQPGIILGEAGEGKVKIATTGRVKVRVDAGKKGIQVGDLLVTSDREGIAMKSEPLDLGGVPIHRPGTLIGKALEPLKEGEGEILVLLSLQ